MNDEAMVPDDSRRDARGCPMPRDGWTCYHCGETFTTWGSAEDHFGKTPQDVAACKLGGERGLVMELRKAKAMAEEQLQRALQAERDIETLECRVSALTADFKSYKPFRNCSSANEAFFIYDSMEGRALAAEERVAVLERLLNTPEVENFDRAIPLEAGHQVERWGAKVDAGKSPADWFWLVGYLAGKALAAHLAGNTEKAKHHCISTAAVLRNWHAHIRSGETVMRPGIEADKTAGVANE